MAGPAPLICVLGSINVDLTFRAPHLPQPGETVLGQSLIQGHGGKGANQAVMAAKLGRNVAMVGRVGTDSFGDAALDNLHRHGIDTTHIRRDPERATGVASIVVDDAGENQIVVAPGANAAISVEDVRAASRAICTSRILVAQLETPIEATLEAFRRARQAGAITILNPAPAAPLPEELYRLTDWLVPNLAELGQLVGRPVDTDADIEAAMAELRTRGPRELIVTRGERGVSYLIGNECRHEPAEIVTAVDTSGAGDAFVGALAWGLMGLSMPGIPLSEAVKLAQMAAASSVTRPGTQTSFPSLGQLDEFRRSLGDG